MDLLKYHWDITVFSILWTPKMYEVILLSQYIHCFIIMWICTNVRNIWYHCRKFSTHQNANNITNWKYYCTQASETSVKYFNNHNSTQFVNFCSIVINMDHVFDVLCTTKEVLKCNKQVKQCRNNASTICDSEIC